MLTFKIVHEYQSYSNLIRLTDKDNLITYIRKQAILKFVADSSISGCNSCIRAYFPLPTPNYVESYYVKETPDEINNLLK